MPRSYIFFLCVVLLGTLPGRAWGGGLSGEGQIFASSYPLAYFAQRISGDLVSIVSPDIRGNPAQWKPSVDDILEIQQAKVILLNGAGMEKWVKRVSLPLWRVVDTSRTFRGMYLNMEGAVTHSHGPEGEHAHGETAFTTWLDLSQALEQAEAVKSALVAAKLGSEEELTKNYELLRQDLLALDKSTTEITKVFEGEAVFASLPIYQYFARRYKLDVRSLLWEPDASPDDGLLWEALEYFRREHPASVMIWQRVPHPETVRLLEEEGIKSVVFNPLLSRPETGDFLSVMHRNVQNLKSALQ